MNINGVNLVPVERREARRRRRRSRAWIGVCVSYIIAWVAVHVAMQATMASDDRVMRGEIDRLSAVVQAKNTAIDDLDLDRQQAVAQVQANLAVGRQPDWSILLALLGSTLEDEVVLRSVRLASTGAGESAESSGERPVTSLDFAGLGESQAAVSRFVLRLEETPMFRSVKLLDTRREPFLAGHATAFRVECVLDDGGGVSP
jgi:Tfp pilus assembly protein PilN